MDNGETDAKAFAHLLQFFCDHSDQGNQTEAFNRLHKFGVSTDTPFLVFVLELRILVSSVPSSARTVKLTPEMVIENTWTRFSTEYPGHMTTRDPGDLVAA